MSSPQEIDILLVEDNPNDAELTQRALKKSDLGARLAIARDGAEALDYLLGNRPRPKVVFLDLKLPKIDGIEVLRRGRGAEAIHFFASDVLFPPHGDGSQQQQCKNDAIRCN